MKEIETKQIVPQEQVFNIGRGKGNKYKQRVPLKPGQRVFELNLITGEVWKAKYKAVAANMRGNKQVEELIENENCIYIPALTKKEAKKIFDGITAKVKAQRSKK